jgi:hypothetical protein
LFGFDGLVVNIARLAGNIFINNKTHTDNLKYIGRLAFAMKRQVEEEEEDIHTTHTTPYEAKDAFMLGSWVKMQMQNASTAARI